MSMFPHIPEEDVVSDSVVRPWLANLSFKQQTVLLTALRGYDGVNKEDKSKPLVKCLRATILHNADSSSGFMVPKISSWDVTQFFEDAHHYPSHWLLHFIHAAEIVGYNHPHALMRSWWMHVYMSACNMLHVNPETHEQCNERLRDVRG